VLTFAPEKHEYRWNGTVVPSVTTVLSPLVDLSRIPRNVLEDARARGTAIHRMIELHAKGDLDEDNLPQWLQHPFAQWLKFLDQTGFEIDQSEQRVYHAQYGYAGTFDLTGKLRGKRRRALIDIKRSLLAGRVIGFQTAAYANAIDPGSAFDRYALRLHDDKPYQLEPYQASDDFHSFLTALAFHKLRQRIMQ